MIVANVVPRPPLQLQLVESTRDRIGTLCLESLGVTVIVCWADARVYPLANL
jgi:hypothetical protein